jgi:hypothetical protein
MEHANGVLHEANNERLSISHHFINDNKSAAGRLNCAQISVMSVLFSARLSSLELVRREDKHFATFLPRYRLLILSKEQESCLRHTLTPLRFLKKSQGLTRSLPCSWVITEGNFSTASTDRVPLTSFNRQTEWDFISRTAGKIISSKFWLITFRLPTTDMSLFTAI